ncbi:hypothetical protein AMJ71_02280 [candidate division TA06 bacterium SM1_40]|uniref:Uncharacterized protein n=1 Tax=candidate division TA06 bacterium SM1_40 TaxID=1703773 RepID=A0A0S8JM14_UNCT6|nr:MAG: hypothetical protein AMJ71_02280 [candidate division TA06 bacterium SM1_40]
MASVALPERLAGSPGARLSIQMARAALPERLARNPRARPSNQMGSVALPERLARNARARLFDQKEMTGHPRTGEPPSEEERQVIEERGST